MPVAKPDIKELPKVDGQIDSDKILDSNTKVDPRQIGTSIPPKTYIIGPHDHHDLSQNSSKSSNCSENRTSPSGSENY